jgi:hypothetical protein
MPTEIILKLDDESKKLLKDFMDFAKANEGARVISEALNTITKTETPQRDEPPVNPVRICDLYPKSAYTRITHEKPSQWFRNIENAKETPKAQVFLDDKGNSYTCEQLVAMQEYLEFLHSQQKHAENTNPFTDELNYVFKAYKAVELILDEDEKWPWISVHKNLAMVFRFAKRVVPKTKDLVKAIAVLHTNDNLDFKRLYREVLNEIGIEGGFKDVPMKFYPWLCYRLNLCMPS